MPYLSGVVSCKNLTLGSAAFVPDDPIPPEIWEGLTERNRRVLLAGRYVRKGEPAVMVRHRVAGLHQAAPTPVRPPAPLVCDHCGESFATKQALGGHRRGHVKRGEV